MMKVKQLLFKVIDIISARFRVIFVANGTDNKEVRKKHIRVGIGLVLGIMGFFVIVGLISESIDSGKIKMVDKNVPQTNHLVEVSNLKNGVSHEQTWMEGAEKQILDLRVHQQLNEEKQIKIEESLENNTISKKDLLSLLEEHKRETDAKIDAIKNQNPVQSNVILQQPQGSQIEIIENKTKVKLKKIGAYIPAGSYVEAKMISGVDAGIGVTAEADPRQVLLRVIGKVISAGYGKDYLTTDKLMGCVVQCQAVGDLSSEKAYLKPVLMTCAKDKESVIEIPVKGYVSSSGKVGIRGEIVSREDSLVAQSFLSGLVGGIGSGVSQVYEPSHALSNGFAVSTGQTAKNILGTGFGRGVNDSSSRLSDYLIKRAEQYQPVISIDEGVSVDLVFQEGFLMNEDEEGTGNGKN